MLKEQLHAAPDLQYGDGQNEYKQYGAGQMESKQSGATGYLIKRILAYKMQMPSQLFVCRGITI